jgi:hypothetical protein
MDTETIDMTRTLALVPSRAGQMGVLADARQRYNGLASGVISFQVDREARDSSFRPIIAA